MTLLIKTCEELKKEILKLKKKRKAKIGLVPTMGALHDGHFSLVKESLKQNEFTIVSIFVNPTQFGPNEDYDKYPRTLEADVEKLTEMGVTIAFAPSVEEMYEDGVINMDCITYVAPPYDLISKLCGKSRPKHFDGVGTVVTKLFNLTQADRAYFGMKDAQQVAIVKKIVKDLNMNIEIIPCPIVREKSGLAMSSRNKYLSNSGKKKALALSKTVFTIEQLVKKEKIKDVKYLIDVALKLLKDTKIDYVEFVDYDNLQSLKEVKDNTLFAIAAKVDDVRLIDNILLRF